jgi:zinc/manganese transport system substrate-binding protein
MSPQPAAQETQAAAGPTIVVTTNVLGDIVQQIVGDDGTVEVLMAPGQDAHSFSPSAQQAQALRSADLVVANGLQLEEQLVSILEAAEEDGVRVLHLAELLDPLPFEDDDAHAHEDDDAHADDDAHGHDDDHGHDDADEGHGHGHDDDGHDDDDGHGHDDDDGHADDDHGHDDDDHGHDHGEFDPHIWFDPIRMAEGARVIAATIAEVDQSLDGDTWLARGDAVASDIEAVDAAMAEVLSVIPAECRLLVTNHDAFGYLAARYDLEILATVIPGSSTQVETSARWFAELAQTLRDTQVPAVFSETVQSTRLADALVEEVGYDLQVVELYTESLGEPGSGAETYTDMMLLNAQRIADALKDC